MHDGDCYKRLVCRDSSVSPHKKLSTKQASEGDTPGEVAEHSL